MAKNVKQIEKDSLLQQEELSSVKGSELSSEPPKASKAKEELPETEEDKRTIVIAGRKIVINPIRVLYMRSGNGSIYRLLERYPIIEFLASSAEDLGLDRSGEQLLFDFLVAVFNDSEIVSEIFDDITIEDIYNIIRIYRYVNKIDEKEEERKNLIAKEMSN